MNVVNLTPSTINIIVEGEPELAYPPSGQITRVAEIAGYKLDGYPFPATGPSDYGEVVGLPAQADSVVYIVSGMVAAACPDRSDLFSPGEMVRNEIGQIIGAKNLKRAC